MSAQLGPARDRGTRRAGAAPIAIGIELDSEYGDPREHTDIPAIAEYEREGFTSGELAPYVLYAIDADTGAVLDSLAGVVGAAGLDGRSYPSAAEVPDDYVRGVAADMGGRR